MRRVYYVFVLACLWVLALVSISPRVSAQSKDRRGEPNAAALATGYFVVDSDDNAPLPWRPQYFFVDTGYNPIEWYRVGTGPQQFLSPGAIYFFNPTYTIGSANYDSSNDAMAGPIAMRMGQKWNYYGASYDSVYISSNGFIGFRPYSEAAAGTPPSYCRGNNSDLGSAGGAAAAPRAIIAALWADLDMRHGGRFDTSLVYYRTSTSQDSFYVNFYNFRLRPASPNSFSPASFSSPGADRIYIQKMQIVLSNADSSIQINYGRFVGSINGFPPTLAYRLFQNNVAIGLVNESGNQYTGVLYKNKWEAINNITCRSCNKDFRQNGQWALKFRRWHDVVRAISVDYPTRNYEICLGTSVVPQATFVDVDPNSAHVHDFKARFQIRNVVTGIVVYSRVVVCDTAPTIPQKKTFVAYATNPNILSELGTFNACAVATTYDSADNNIGDQWPFDDTVCIRVFGVRRTQQPYRDYSNNYSKTISADIPDQTLWISIGAQVVDGEASTWDPPPPRDLSGGGYGADAFISPAIRIDRVDVDGNTYAGSGVGDTLMSFPINLLGQTRANLMFDFMRSGRIAYPWLFDADVMQGCEHTVTNINGVVVRPGDSMIIEFKKPTEPGCNPAATGWTPIVGITGGHDFEFKKFFMAMTPTTATIQVTDEPVAIKTIANYFTSDFRFRFRLKAKYDGAVPPPPSDDDDPWYIDNPTIIVPRKPEIEVMWVRVVSPYTKIPASEAVTLPIYTKIKNNSTDVAIPFPLRVQILDANGQTVYWQSLTVSQLGSGRDSVIKLPPWNAQLAIGGTGIYTTHCWIDQPGYQAESPIMGTYTKFALNVDAADGVQEFAYDNAGISPGPGAGNDIPGLTLTTGAGIGFNQNSGTYAVKFQLSQKDTVYGARVYFANANQSGDDIRISLLNGDPNSCTPGDTVLQSNVQTTFQDIRRGGYFNMFWPYYFPKPIVLSGGTDAGASQGVYWIGVSQLGLSNYEMGGNLSRGGALVTVADGILPKLPPLYQSKYGTSWSQTENTGDVSCVWALEVTAGSQTWSPWTPKSGFWPTNGFYQSANYQFWAGSPNQSLMIKAGSYTPMIRPMVSKAIMLPIELVYLHGNAQDGAALLTWATASEKNNEGFDVERRLSSAKDDFFEKIAFVGAKGANSTTETGYGYIDRNVQPGAYTYRLVQRDINGAEHVTNSVEVSIDPPQSFSLQQNYPNPFVPTDGSTDISFTVPVNAPTTLVIYNQLGEVVRTLVDNDYYTGSHQIAWDGKDNAKQEVAAGTYIAKLASGEHNASIKITVVK
jgi:hypothetical protein